MPCTNQDPFEITRGFSRCRILIVGDLLLDRYIFGVANRLSPEAPVPVVRKSHTKSAAGGAANVAANVASLGGSALLAGIIGSDAAGEELCRALATAGVNLEHVLATSDRHTAVKTRIVAHNQHLVRLDEEDTTPVAAQVTDRLLEHLTPLLPSIDVVIVSDYAKGLLTPRFLRQLMDAAAGNNRPVIVDPKHADCRRYNGAHLLTPNQMEAMHAAGLSMDCEDGVGAAGRTLLETLQIDSLLITEGPAGMTLFDRHNLPLRIPATARAIFDVTGAGDTVIATLGLAIASGADLPMAARLANVAAGLSVETVGTAAVAAAELENALINLPPAVHGITTQPLSAPRLSPIP